MNETVNLKLMIEGGIKYILLVMLQIKRMEQLV